MSITTVTTRITRAYLERKTKAELAQWYLDLLDENDRIMRLAACPCCKDGQAGDHTCQECHGKALVSVAYDTARIHLKQAQEELAYSKEIYDRVFDDRESLLAALRVCVSKGHHDTCSHALSAEYACDCGHEAGIEAIGNRMSNKGLKMIMDAVERTMPHASDCASWVGESCDCVTGKPL